MAEKKLTPEEFYKRLSKEDKRAIKNLNEKKKTDFIPTGSWVVNHLIGDGSGTKKAGGLPRGHVVEVYGDESCGKTTLGISACRQVQLMGGVPVWLDYERTFSKDYATKLGLDCSPNKFIFIEPSHFEHGIKLLNETLALRPWLVVVDSVSAMIPKQFLEGAIDEMGRIGLQAHLMSVSLNYMSKLLPESNTCLLLINQLRSVIKKNAYVPGPDQETSGGMALRYYSSVRISMRKSTVEKVLMKSHITGKTEKEPLNVMVKVTIAKNKIDKPYYSGPVYIRFGEGYDNITSVIELAVNTNTIKKVGGTFQFDSGDKTIFKINGKEQLRAMLDENPEILKLLSSSIIFKEDEQVKLEEEQAEDNEPAGDLDLLLDQTNETFKNKKKKGSAAPEDSDDEKADGKGKN